MGGAAVVLSLLLAGALAARRATNPELPQPDDCIEALVSHRAITGGNEQSPYTERFVRCGTGSWVGPLAQAGTLGWTSGSASLLALQQRPRGTVTRPLLVGASSVPGAVWLEERKGDRFARALWHDELALPLALERGSDVAGVTERIEVRVRAFDPDAEPAASALVRTTGSPEPESGPRALVASMGAR